MQKLNSTDQEALDRSLADACKIARRLSRCHDSQGRSAALRFIGELRRLGAQESDNARS